MKRILSIFFLLCLCLSFQAQDTLHIFEKSAELNRSIAFKFHIAEDMDKSLQVEDLLNDKSVLEFKQLSGKQANLDFTTGRYWVHFVVVNKESKSQEIIFETARPVTNKVVLYEMSSDKSEITILRSGDAIPFSEKTIQDRKSLFRIYLPAKTTKEYFLELESDGEIISLPMIFWQGKKYNELAQTGQFLSGIFYGIFLFVALIYFTFYVMLRDRSFILYVLYVLFSASLQFSLDGYIHQYVFKGGGYLTQHSVIFVSGFTVIFVTLYSANYLKLSQYFPKLFNVAKGFAILVFSVVLISLIPGITYEISYPLINGMSLLSTLFVLMIAILVRRKDKNVNPLFVVGIAILICGAVIFILGNFSVINYPRITQNALKIATLIEILCLSIVMAGKYRQLQNEKEEAQKTLLIELEGINTKLEAQVKERTARIEEQKAEIEERNKDVMASIKYAERLQRAILPSDEKFFGMFPNSFIYYNPRDIVSGDFYWSEVIHTTSENSRKLLVYATADCTGHGVPGAFVSIIASNLLKMSKSEREVNTPAEALDFINTGINEAFNTDNEAYIIRDGMDVALCAIDEDNDKLYYAGAKNPLYIVRGGELMEFKADKQPIGNVGIGETTNFTNNEIDLLPGDLIYTFSDGYADQFGGIRKKKYKYKQFKELLLSIAEESMIKQRDILAKEFQDWKGELEQLDDVLVIGVKYK